MMNRPNHWISVFAAAAFTFLVAACSSGSDPEPPQTPIADPYSFPVPSRIVAKLAPFATIDAALAAETQVDWLHDGPLPGDVRRRMESDVVWFETTASRYRLLAAASDFVVERAQGESLDESRARIARELDFLRQSPVFGDTVSGVNQSLFLDLTARLAGLQ